MTSARMKWTIRVAATTGAFILAVVSLAAAHDTWLLPTKARVAVGEQVTLDMTSGMAFPKNESAIDSSRVAEARIRVAGEEAPLRIQPGSKASLRLNATPRRVGVATIWVRLKPRTLELKPDQVREYLDEIGAPDSIRVLYSPSAPARRWREQYTKYAKTIVVVGGGGRDSSWQTATRPGLEIVPLTNPANLIVGDTVVVRVLRAGKPAPDFAIGDVAEDERSTRITRTDEAGIGRLVPKKVGRWLLRGTDLRRPVSDTTSDWQSEFTTLTLFVRDRR